MSNRFSCDTCYLRNSAHCPHVTPPSEHFCEAYAPAGEIWDAFRDALCPRCPQYTTGVCGLSGMPPESTPSTECTMFQTVRQNAIAQSTRPAGDAPASSAAEASAAAPAPSPIDDDMAAYPGMDEYLHGGMAAGLTAEVPAATASATPAPAPADDDMAAYPGMDEYLHGGMAPGLTAEVPADQLPPQGGRKTASQPRTAAKAPARDKKPPAAPPRREDRRPAAPEKPAAPRKPNLHLYFLNPCSVLGVLLIFTAFGFIFHIPRWDGVAWQTGVCLMALLPCVSLVFGLVWGVMNPQSSPARFAISALLGAAAAKMVWSSASFAALLISLGTGFAAMCLCYFTAWLGILITNAIFRVKKRVGQYMPGEQE